MVSKASVRNTVAAAALLVGGWVTGCTKPDAVSCGTGIYCPAGWQCAARQKICIETPCGNGVVDPGEKCDDGGIDPTDDPPDGRCNATCTSNQTCGNDVTDPDFEACDPTDPAFGVDGCESDCSRTKGCGNGRVDQDKVPPEECDKGDKNGWDADCLPGCKLNVCGDTRINRDDPDDPTDRFEECDDGTTEPKTDCTYGIRTPQVLCSQCHEVTCELHYCGDGNWEWPEECDDGNNDTEECDYGQATCNVCDSGCHVVTRTGLFCGDGKVTGSEGCDAVESFACRTCGSPAATSGRCQWQGHRAAEGSLTVASADLAGVTLKLNDDVNEAPVTFQFVNGDTAPDGRVPIRITNADGDGLSAGDIAVRLHDAIAAHDGLRIDAWMDSTLVVGLRNQRDGISGSVPIEVSDSRKLVPDGMASGRGCRSGQACARSEDCVGWTCVAGFCQ